MADSILIKRIYYQLKIFIFRKITTGNKVINFEKISKFTKAKYSVNGSSGTFGFVFSFKKLLK